MKSTLDHLPEKKQRQLRAVADLIRDEADPEMVILFGSHARGDWVEDPAGLYFSDFDVLVIVKSRGMVDKRDLWSKIEQQAQRITKPTELSLIVHDIRDVNEQLEKGFYFFSDIKKEGVLIYDSGRHQLAEAKERPAAERRAYAEKCFADWSKSARGFLRQHEHAVEDGELNIAAFELHQAAERFYHCALLVLTAYKPKTHNLEDLGKRAADLHPLLRNVFPRDPRGGPPLQAPEARLRRRALRPGLRDHEGGAGPARGARARSARPGGAGVPGAHRGDAGGVRPAADERRPATRPGSPHQGNKHPPQPLPQGLDRGCLLGVHRADDRREIDAADRLVQAAERAREVLPPHRRPLVWEALAEVEEHALGRPGGLITKLRVPDLRRMDAAGELACGDVRVEALEGHLLVRHGILLAGPAKARRLLPLPAQFS